MSENKLLFTIPTTCREGWYCINCTQTDELRNSGSAVIAGDDVTLLLNQLLKKSHFLINYPASPYMIDVDVQGPYSDSGQNNIETQNACSGSEPDKSALRLTLLLSELYFSEQKDMPLGKLKGKQIALAAGYDFYEGVKAISIDTPPPELINTRQSNIRNILLLTTTNNPVYFDPDPDRETLSGLTKFLPNHIEHTCVYFPLVGGEYDELGKITVEYVNTPTQPELGYAPATTTGTRLLNIHSHGLLNRLPHLKSQLHGKLYISFEGDFTTGTSWQLAFVSALQMACGLLPKPKTTLIMTGEAFNESSRDPQNPSVYPVNGLKAKWRLLKTKKMKEQKQMLLLADGRPNCGAPWQFYVPAAGDGEDDNYQSLASSEGIKEQQHATGIELYPVAEWFYKNL